MKTWKNEANTTPQDESKKKQGSTSRSCVTNSKSLWPGLRKQDVNLLALGMRSASCSPPYGPALRNILDSAMLLIVFLTLLLIPTNGMASAAIDEKKVIPAILNEAENENLLGKQAVAEATRNRGTLEGVIGSKEDPKKALNRLLRQCQEKYPKNQPALNWCRELSQKKYQRMLEDAKKAWLMSAKSNLVKGATHWENVSDFGEPRWAKGAKVTAHIGKHIFYSEVK